MLVCSLFAMPMLRCLPFACQPPNCHDKPLTHHVLANRWLAMLPLCSAPLIALLVAGEDWRSFLVGTLFIVGISPYYLVYLSASIYLVKGGRLGLMPSVLFHSCRPSFCHTGVMFLDFVSLTRWEFMGPSWQFVFNKTLPARPNIGFNICHNNIELNN